MREVQALIPRTSRGQTGDKTFDFQEKYPHDWTFRVQGLRWDLEKMSVIRLYDSQKQQSTVTKSVTEDGALIL